MYNTVKILVFLLTSVLLKQSALWCQVNYYSPERIYQFAEHLYQSKDYLRAASEFQRYIFSFDSPNFSDSLLYKIGLCYQFAGEEDKAINNYEKIIVNYPESQFYDHSCYQIAYMSFESKKYNESIGYIQSSLDKMNSARGRLKMNRLAGINYLYQRKWNKARQHFFSMLSNVNADNSSLTETLNNFAIEGSHIKYKNPVFAGLMSTVIPGSGKIYTGRVMDGFYSMILIGLMEWQAYKGFHKDGVSSVRGWVYGTLGAVSHLGNIYGSVAAVKIYNKKLEDKFLHGIQINFSWM